MDAAEKPGKGKEGLLDTPAAPTTAETDAAPQISIINM